MDITRGSASGRTLCSLMSCECFMCGNHRCVCSQSTRRNRFRDFGSTVKVSCSLTLVQRRAALSRSGCGLTDGLEAFERVGNADEVLAVVLPAAGKGVLSGLSLGGEVRGAVDQPEAPGLIQQHDT